MNGEWTESDVRDALESFPRIVMPNGEDYMQSIQPKQRDFHFSEHKFRGLGGGVGGGKTAPAVIEAIKQSWIYPNNFGFILRRTFPELRISTKKDFDDLCPQFLLQSQDKSGLRVNKTEMWYDLLNYKGMRLLESNSRMSDDELSKRGGLSRVQFLSFEDGRAAFAKVASANVGWYCIDQAEEATEEVKNGLDNRMRRVPSARRAWFVWNPAGQNWLWKLFHPNSEDHKPELYHLIDFETSDNPFLPADYEETLRETYSEDMIERYLQGSYDSFVGSIYKDMDVRMHAIDPFPIPADWRKGVGLDHGLNNPTAAVFAAEDKDGNIYVFEEHYQAGWLVSQHAEALKEKVQKCMHRVIDPSCHNRNPHTGTSVIQEYAKYGLFFSEGNNDVAAGLNRVAEYLYVDPERIHPLTHQKGSPRLFFFRTCRMAIREHIGYQWATLKVNWGRENEPEKPKNYNDHTCDALRYLMMQMAQPVSFVMKRSAEMQSGDGAVQPAVVELNPEPRIRKLQRQQKQGSWMGA